MMGSATVLTWFLYDGVPKAQEDSADALGEQIEAVQGIWKPIRVIGAG